MESILMDEDAIDEGVADKLKKRKQDDADKDEGLLLDQTEVGLKLPKDFQRTSKSQNQNSTDKSHTADGRHCFRLETLKRQRIKDKTWVNIDDQHNVRSSKRWTGSRNLKGLRLLIRIGMLEKLLKQKNILSFNELMSTPIDFSVYVMNNLKINNLAQEHLVGHAFNLLKGTCRKADIRPSTGSRKLPEEAQYHKKPFFMILLQLEDGLLATEDEME
ncbi:hypothetical protein Tco_0839842 [Tanacetum coccineum]|uniref:Uncharacterized protein n=1 Tax=Tanacetum coccineum TaxID=301880 RepID=A0ABQ5ART7_9ASTR